jgi:hypothetical protein
MSGFRGVGIFVAATASILTACSGPQPAAREESEPGLAVQLGETPPNPGISSDPRANVNHAPVPNEASPDAKSQAEAATGVSTPRDDRVRRAVVYICSGGGTGTLSKNGDEISFAVDRESSHGNSSLGAGVFISEDGYVLTAAHLLGEPLYVYYLDGDRIARDAEARVIVEPTKLDDPSKGVASDMAILKVRVTTKVTCLLLAAPREVKPRAQCVSYGSGAVSDPIKPGAIGSVSLGAETTAHPLPAIVINHTCPVGPGDSGGPLVLSGSSLLAGVNVRATIAPDWRPPLLWQAESLAVLPYWPDVHMLITADRKKHQQ